MRKFFLILLIFCNSLNLFAFSNEAYIECIELFKQELPRTSKKNVKVQFIESKKYAGTTYYRDGQLLIEFDPENCVDKNTKLFYIASFLDNITHELAHCEMYLMGKTGHGKDFERIRFALYRKVIDKYYNGDYDDTLFVAEYEKSFHDELKDERILEARYDDQTLKMTDPKAIISTEDKLYLEIYNFKKED